jgi:hypothetical protein
MGMQVGYKREPKLPKYRTTLENSNVYVDFDKKKYTWYIKEMGTHLLIAKYTPKAMKLVIYKKDVGDNVYEDVPIMELVLEILKDKGLIRYE